MNKQFVLLPILSLTFTLSCSNKNEKKVTIINKISTISLIEKSYALEIETKNVEGIKLAYTISDSNIADIDSEGIIYPKNIGNVVVTASLDNDNNVKDSFNLEIVEASIRGVIKDKDNNPLPNVNVSTSSGIKTKSDNKGAYSLKLDDTSGVLSFDCVGYVSESIDIAKHIRLQSEYVYDLVMVKPENAHQVTIKGTITNINGTQVSEDVGVFANGFKAKIEKTADNKINYTLSNIFMGNKVVVEAFHNTITSTENEVTYIDGQTTYTCDIELKRFQPGMKFFIHTEEGSTFADKLTHVIYGNVYHGNVAGDKGLIFTLTPNYKNAIDELKTFAIYLNIGSKSSASYDEKNSNNLDIVLTKNNGVWDIVWNQPTKGFWSHRHGDTETSLTQAYSRILHIPDANDSTLSFFVDNMTISDGGDTTYDEKSTTGFALECLETEGTNYKMETGIFTHPMNKSNQYSYIRLYGDDSIKAASHNVNPYIINGEELTFNKPVSRKNYSFVEYKSKPVVETDTEILGSVGVNLHHGYDLKIARNTNNSDSLYFIIRHHYESQNPFFLTNEWRPHIFIDSWQGAQATDYPTQPAAGSAEDVKRYGQVRPYMIDANFDLCKYTAKGTGKFMEDGNYLSKIDATKTQFKNEDIYTCGNEIILKVPYSAISDKFSASSYFGVSANLFFRSWGDSAWRTPNPSGYENIPHIEELPSLFRIKVQDMTIVKKI